MKKKLNILVALAAGIAAIAIGQRTQNQANDTKQRDTRTQKAQVEGVDDAEHWFV